MEHTRHARRSDFLPPPRGGMARIQRWGRGREWVAWAVFASARGLAVTVQRNCVAALSVSTRKMIRGVESCKQQRSE
jgi:hypothetical protein